VPEKLLNTVSSTFDDDLYSFLRAAAANDGVDVSTYIRKAIAELRDKELSRYRLFNNVFDNQINNK
jgi:hypothetical protein